MSVVTRRNLAIVLLPLCLLTGSLAAVVLSAVATPFPAPRLTALTLLVYERDGCPWCARWNSEIAPIFPKTETGKLVLLRRINLDSAQSDDPKLDDPVRFTPTFVLMRDGGEVGRITGYHNDAFFWGLLEAMVQKQITPSTTSNRS